MDNLGVPSGEYFDARLFVCGNLPVQLRLNPGNPVQPLYLEDPMRMFSGVSSASASARLAFPTLFLSPIPNGRNYCLHDGDDGVSFRAILHPMAWADNLSFSTISGFALQDDGTLWLQAPNPRATGASSTGSVAFHTPWLYHGELAESATIHWCAGEGSYCYACGHVHSDLNNCSHDPNCAAKSGLEAECDCTPIFVRVNFNDDDLDGMEDRYDTAPSVADGDWVEFSPVSIGSCCCEWSGNGPLVRITDISSGLRLWSDALNQLHVGSTVSDPTFWVEATAASVAIGLGYVSYDILNEDGSTLRSITRRFTMANVQIMADLDDGGTIDIGDSALTGAGLGKELVWKIAKRENPYLIRIRNECAVNEGRLSLSLTSNQPICPFLGTAGNDILFPGEVTNSSPFCVRNTSSAFHLFTYMDGDATASLTYSLDFEGCHAPIHDTLNIQVVDIDLPDYVVRTNEVGSIVYDYSHISTSIDWELEDVNAQQRVDTAVGGVYSPPPIFPKDTIG